MSKRHRTPLKNSSFSSSFNFQPQNGKKYKFHTSKIIQHDRQLSLLESHVQNRTTPEGLVPRVNCNLHLSETHRQKWIQILEEAGRKLRNVIIDHHKEQINQHKQERNTIKASIAKDELTRLDKEVKDQYEINATLNHNRTHSSQNRKRKSNESTRGNSSASKKTKN